MSKLLDGKTAIVTGASEGLGLAISTALCADGASVLMVAREEEKLASAAAGEDEEQQRYAADIGSAPVTSAPAPSNRS